MDTQQPQAVLSRSKSSRFAGAPSTTSLLGIQQVHRHQVVHRDAAIAATNTITQDAHLHIVYKTGRSMNQKQDGVECEYIHTMVNSSQLTIYHTAGVHLELRDQYIAAWYREHPWLTKASGHTVGDIEHHGVVSSGIFRKEFPTAHPPEWMKQT